MIKTLNLKIYLRNDIEFLDDEKISIPVKTIFFLTKKMILVGLLSIALMVHFSYYMLMFEILSFLGKLTMDPKYYLLYVDLFTSKVYVYSMKSRKSKGDKALAVKQRLGEIKKGFLDLKL